MFLILKLYLNVSAQIKTPSLWFCSRLLFADQTACRRQQSSVQCPAAVVPLCPLQRLPASHDITAVRPLSPSLLSHNRPHIQKRTRQWCNCWTVQWSPTKEILQSEVITLLLILPFQMTQCSDCIYVCIMYLLSIELKLLVNKQKKWQTYSTVKSLHTLVKKMYIMAVFSFPMISTALIFLWWNEWDTYLVQCGLILNLL